MMHSASYQNTLFIPTMLYAEALAHDLFSCGRCVSDSDRMHVINFIKLFALFKTLI